MNHVGSQQIRSRGYDDRANSQHTVRSRLRRFLTIGINPLTVISPGTQRCSYAMTCYERESYGGDEDANSNENIRDAPNIPNFGLSDVYKYQFDWAKMVGTRADGH
jgi:hypothetical protein